MNYLIKRGNQYYYNRRIPIQYKAFLPGKFVRISLKTDSRSTAQKLAFKHNERLEAYWTSLLMTGETHEDKRYKSIVERSSILGFPYYEACDIASLPLHDIAARLLHIEKNQFNAAHVEAILGGATKPIVRLGDVLPKFWEYTKDQTVNKSAHQIKKWRNPREKAMRNFIDCIGNKKAVHELVRDDMLKFRKWWLDRIEKKSLVCASANKDFMHVKTILTTVADNLKIRLDKDYLFGRIRFKEDDSEQRLSFETSYIVETLLNPKRLIGLNEQAKYVLYAIAETGAGVAELVGLLPEEIVLDAPIPYIDIKPGKKKGLKTKYRARKIPLIGYALEAFKACPNGFTNYICRPDTLSTTLGKFLSENKLFPSEKHSVYSLRHSFQDRLLAVNAPDRVQADLMGHKFSREAYGKGATLEKKLEWLLKVELMTIAKSRMPDLWLAQDCLGYKVKPNS